MKVAVVLSQLPLQGSAARESLDLIFALAAVDYQLSVIFNGDSVYQLLPATDSADVLLKDFRRSFKLFDLYEIEQLYVCAESLKQRHIDSSNLSLNLQVLHAEQLNQLLTNQQHVIKA